MLNETAKKQYDEFSHLVYSEGNLTKKEKELIAFACSVMIDCKHCMLLLPKVLLKKQDFEETGDRSQETE